MSEKVLCVDDDPSILAAYQRVLRKQFAIDTARGAAEALELMGREGPYAVIVADLRMPGIDGIRFLAEARVLAPRTTRIMLTGHADVTSAMEAVNEGNLFRFLTKPCPPETLARALDAGIAQYRLVMAEKELLEKTLRGSVKMLTDVLSLVKPAAFGRASRVRRLARELGTLLGVEAPWQLEVAAMLSQLGWLMLPDETLEKTLRAQPLLPSERRLLQDHPRVGHDLVANIPRLEPIATIILHQDRRYDGSGAPDAVKGDAIPLGARILKVALDFDTLASTGLGGARALRKLRERPGWYDPAVVDALAGLYTAEPDHEVRGMTVDELTLGMVFAEDVRSTSGLLLITRGQEVTPTLRIRLRSLAAAGALPGPLQIQVVPDAWAPRALAPQGATPGD